MGARWEPSDDERLRELVYEQSALRKLDWPHIAAEMGRSYKACYDRWCYVIGTPRRTGPWTPEEDAQLTALVMEHMNTYTFKPRWTKIAHAMHGTRNGKQCRERWTEHLDPSANRQEWTSEEESRLQALVKQYGPAWSEIARSMGTNRPPNDVKNHWNNLSRERRWGKRARYPRSKPTALPVITLPLWDSAASTEVAQELFAFE
jgi:myb proto-oncogene protein